MSHLGQGSTNMLPNDWRGTAEWMWQTKKKKACLDKLAEPKNHTFRKPSLTERLFFKPPLES